MTTHKKIDPMTKKMSGKKRGKFVREAWIFEGEQFMCLPSDRYEESRPRINEAEKLKKVRITIEKLP